MPRHCVIVGCKNVSRKGGVRMFNVPRVRKNEGKDVEEKTERRLRMWIKAINRKGIDVNTVKKYQVVCSEHFIKGRPAFYMMETDPDWVPSQKLGYNSHTTTSGTAERFKRAQERKRRKQDVLAADALLTLSKTVAQKAETVKKAEEHQDPKETEGTAEVEKVVEEMRPQSSTSVETQTDVTGAQIVQNELVLRDMTLEIASLKAKLTNIIFDEGMFTDNAENVKHYTGLPSWGILNHLICFLSPVITQNGKNSLTKFQEIILVLMKLRLGLSNKLLGDIFHIDKRTVSRVFLRVLNVMYHHLKFLIIWPDRDTFKKTMPLEFVKHFSRRVIVIINCFEILIVKPSNIKTRDQTHSNSKSNNTIKYLVGITTQGSICFISDGYGGRATDKDMVENSNFLSNLDLGDLVLADRGFEGNDGISLMYVELKIPSATKGEKQLSVFEVEATRKIGHLRKHVKRVTGNMRSKFTILDSVIPVDYLYSSEDEITPLYQIITVCACLVNLCPSVVSFT